MKEESPGKITVFNVEKGALEEVDKVIKSNEEWRNILPSHVFHITREQGTERAFTDRLLENKKEGIYICALCGNHLFSSDAKYESGTGWPSFWKPVAEENIGTETDNSFFMRRVEVHCPRCGAHLGHVFDDGPPPTHKRYCINGAALEFKETSK